MGSGCRVEGLGFRVCSGFWDFGCWGLAFGAQALGFREPLFPFCYVPLCFPLSFQIFYVSLYIPNKIPNFYDDLLNRPAPEKKKKKKKKNSAHCSRYFGGPHSYGAGNCWESGAQHDFRLRAEGLGFRVSGAPLERGKVYLRYLRPESGSMGLGDSGFN